VTQSDTEPTGLEENVAFEQLYAPERYPDPDPSAQATWCMIKVEGAEAGLIFTDNVNSAGVLWTQFTEGMQSLDEFFMNMKFGNAPAASAYGTASRMKIKGIEYDLEQTGTVDQLHDAFTALLTP
jgi:hypothetical protein